MQRAVVGGGHAIVRDDRSGGPTVRRRPDGAAASAVCARWSADRLLIRLPSLVTRSRLVTSPTAASRLRQPRTDERRDWDRLGYERRDSEPERERGRDREGGGRRDGEKRGRGETAGTSAAAAAREKCLRFSVCT